MFLEFYGLQDHPFGVTPNPRYLYFSPTHREALASLYYGLETECGFLGLVAPPGSGKTTLLFQLLQRMPASTQTAFLFQTQCDRVQLLRYLAEDLNLGPCDADLVSLHARLNAFLLAQAQAGRRVVVVIDEAQNLSDDVLETVRLLSDFETPQRKLLQVVLAGQPDLAVRLSKPALEQLRQRMALLIRLDPLPAAEVVHYINHRLRVAGRDGPSPFSAKAIDIIAEHSAGIPRNINSLCFQALSLGYARGCKRIDDDLLREVVGPTPTLERVRPRLPVAVEHGGQRPHAAHLAMAFLAGGLVMGGVALSRPWLDARSSPRTVSAAPAPVPQAVAAPSVPHEAAGVPAETAHASDPGPTIAPIAARDIKPELPVHVVVPGESLAVLSLRYRGYIDRSFIAQILALNRDIEDPDLVKVGQVIRLPLSKKRKP